MAGAAQRLDEGSPDGVDLGPVVVGVDGSPAGDEALAWAAREAGRSGAPLRVVTALGHHGAPPSTGMAGTTASSLALDLARRVAEESVARARSALPDGVEVSTEVHLSGAAAALLEASERARLVVVGHRGRRAVVSALLGSVAYSVTARAACPVVVVRGDADREPGPDRPVVVGVDTGVDPDDAADGAASPALHLAAATARRSGATLTVLAAVEPVEPLAGGYDLTFAEDMIAHARSRAGRGVDASCAAALRAFPGLDVRAEVVRGRAGDALVAASAQAALVVVGARGLGRVSGLFLGSVSHEVVHRAGCPVVVVRAPRG